MNPCISLVSLLVLSRLLLFFHSTTRSRDRKHDQERDHIDSQQPEEQQQKRHLLFFPYIKNKQDSQSNSVVEHERKTMFLAARIKTLQHQGTKKTRGLDRAFFPSLIFNDQLGARRASRSASFITRAISKARKQASLLPSKYQP